MQEHRFALQMQLKYPVYTSCVHLDKSIIPSAMVTLEIHLSHDQLSVSWSLPFRPEGVIDTPIMVASVNGGGTVLKNYPVNRLITVPC